MQMPMGGNVEFRVYDSAGRQVASVDAASLSEGPNLITIEAGSMATGVYTVVATTGSDISTCRMVLTD